jgi:hypothetical protein
VATTGRGAPSLEEDTSAGSGGGRSRSGGQRSGGDQRRRPSGLRKSGSKSRLRGDVEAQPTVRYARAEPGGGESRSGGYQVRGRPPGQIRAMTRQHSSDAAHVATTTGGGYDELCSRCWCCTAKSGARADASIEARDHLQPDEEGTGSDPQDAVVCRRLLEGRVQWIQRRGAQIQ